MLSLSGSLSRSSPPQWLATPSPYHPLQPTTTRNHGQVDSAGHGGKKRRHATLCSFGIFPSSFLLFQSGLAQCQNATHTQEAKKRPQTPQENTNTSLKWLLKHKSYKYKQSTQIIQYYGKNNFPKDLDVTYLQQNNQTKKDQVKNMFHDSLGGAICAVRHLAGTQVIRNFIWFVLVI